MPKLESSELQAITQKIESLENSYVFLKEIDKDSAQSINPNDTYRTKKLLEIYLATKQKPSVYFATHKPMPFAYPIRIYSIQTHRAILRDNIAKRTESMLKNGLISEVESLASKYPRERYKDIQPFKAIGIKETLAFLDGNIKFSDLQTLITTHTAQLAKRQETFNRQKFAHAIALPKNELKDKILLDIQQNMP